MGLAGSAVVSSTVQLHSPAATARRTVSAQSSGDGPYPSSRSADTGRDVAATMSRAFASASALDTAARPSRRPRVKAKPAEVVAMASNPSPVRMRALPASHAFGSTKQPCRCSAWKRSAVPAAVMPAPA